MITDIADWRIKHVYSHEGLPLAVLKFLIMLHDDTYTSHSMHLLPVTYCSYYNNLILTKSKRLQTPHTYAEQREGWLQSDCGV